MPPQYPLGRQSAEAFDAIAAARTLPVVIQEWSFAAPFFAIFGAPFGERLICQFTAQMAASQPTGRSCWLCAGR
jgi:hypothetical protein